MMTPVVGEADSVGVAAGEDPAVEEDEGVPEVAVEGKIDGVVQALILPLR